MKIERFTFQKSDGRAYIQYHRPATLQKLSGEPPTLLDEGLVRPPSYKEPSIRYHVMREEWVAISASRNDRPFLPPADYCPLCPSDSYSTNAAGEICKTDVPLMSHPYEWAVLENMFPGLGHGHQTGHCEVLLYAADHNAPLSQATPEHIEGLIGVWADRSQEVGARDDVKFVYIFENKGVEVGVTLHHPHGQLYGMNHIPPFIARELDAARKHFKALGHCLICSIAHRESKSTRVVAQTQDLIAFVPEAARYPYEVHITTRTHRPRIEDLTPSETKQLASLLKVVLTKYNLLMNREFPYILAHHQAPHKGDDSPTLDQAYHWHIEFYPPYRSPGKLKYLAGVESGTGLFINDTIPEEKAKELRLIATAYDHLLGTRDAPHLATPASLVTQQSENKLKISQNPHKIFSVKAPGRINLIGEHTDYNGGKVLPFAFDRSINAHFKVFKGAPSLKGGHATVENDQTIIVARSKGHDHELTLTLQDLDRSVLELTTRGLLGQWPVAPDLRTELEATYGVGINQSWHRYVLGALYGWWFHKRFTKRLDKSFEKLPLLAENIQLEITIDSDIPHGAGVSSSAALCLGLVVGLDRGMESFWTAPQLQKGESKAFLSLDQAALRAMWIEHQFAGTRCGLMDQLAIAKAEQGGFLLVDFGNPSPDGLRFPTLSVFPHPLFRDYQWILVNSMVRHDLGSSPYNERRQSCESGLASICQWFQKNSWPQHQASYSGLSLGLLAIDGPFLKQFCPDLQQSTLAQQLSEQKVIQSPTIARRVAHAIMETRRVDTAVGCLKTGDPWGLAAAINGSHESLARDYEVSCNEVEALRQTIFETVASLAGSSPAGSAGLMGQLPPSPPFLGSRMTGGGFGGCLIMGVHRNLVARFCEQITAPQTSFARLTGLAPLVTLVQPEQGLVFYDKT